MKSLYGEKRERGKEMGREGEMKRREGRSREDRRAMEAEKIQCSFFFLFSISFLNCIFSS